MNIENIDKVIKAIKAEADLFVMSSFTFPNSRTGACRTAHCIGGWAAALSPEAEKFARNQYQGHEIGRRFLGLEPHQAQLLFHMENEAQLEAFDMHPPEVRVAVAIDVLERLKETGEVDWEDALYDHGLSDVAVAREDDDE